MSGYSKQNKRIEVILSVVNSIKKDYIDRITYGIKRLVARYLHFKIDKPHERYIVQEITDGVSFKGAQTWVLIFAIFIASLGLNTNSTAVIIGAMLISPLMGPIMGIGLGLGINDFNLIRRAATNWLAATIFAIIASTIYFSITPINEVSSELLARTTPTIYDVLIALFGGLSGIVASSSKQRGNVIPGVAIATALMPPLCTVGYGIATLNIAFVVGAFQLYFINAVFIALSTAFGAKFLRFTPKEQLNASKSKRVRRVVVAFLLAAIVPSAYVTYNIVVTSHYESRAKNFIKSQFNRTNTQILDYHIYTDSKNQKIIDLKLIGQHIPADSILAVQMRLAESGLAGTQLNVLQGYQNGEADIKSLGNEMFGNIHKENQRQIEEQRAKIEELTLQIARRNNISSESNKLAKEVSILFPNIDKIAISQVIENDIKLGKSDTVSIAIICATPTPKESEKELLQNWITQRLSIDSLRIIFDTSESKLRL